MSNQLVLVAVGLLIAVLACRVYFQPRARDKFAHWHHSVCGLDETPDRFYAQVYQALKHGVEQREVVLTDFGFGPSNLFQGHNIFSGQSTYLCARHKHLTFYLFVGQTPSGLYLST